MGHEPFAYLNHHILTRHLQTVKKVEDGQENGKLYRQLQTFLDSQDNHRKFQTIAEMYVVVCSVIRE